MKIAVFPRDANPYQECVYRELRQRGHSMAYIGELTPSQSFNIALLPLQLFAKRITGHRVLHVHWLYLFSIPLIGRHIFVRRLCRYWLLITLKVARVIGIRTVWIVHNVLPHKPIFDDDAAARRTLTAHASAVVAHSSASLAELNEIGCTMKRRYVIRHPGHNVVGKPLDPHPEHLRLLCFGLLSEYKGIPDLLNAIRHTATNVRLVVTGQCADSSLRDEIEQLGDDERVRLRIGWTSDEELAQLIEACDVVVLPFRRVTTSSSVLLAMSAGRGVIIPDLPAFAEIPEPAVRKFAPTPNRVGALATVINQLAARREDADVMSKAASEWAHAVTWSDLCDVLVRASLPEDDAA